jgi:hypothetical protein
MAVQKHLPVRQEPNRVSSKLEYADNVCAVVLHTDKNYPAEGQRVRQPCAAWNPPIGERLIRTGKFLLSLAFGSGILGT